MKNTLIKSSLFLVLVFAFFGATYSNFNIVSDSNNVILSWQTQSEEGLKEISIERKVVNGVFSSIGVVPAKGDNSSYTFVDENAFKVNGGFYTYRLVFINSDGSSPSMSTELGVTHTTDVTKKTWGSIKALFR